MRLHWIDIVVLSGYLLGLVGMGLHFSRRNKSTEEYFLGGRSFSGWVIGLSLVGTSLSSATFLAMPADAFKTAWLRFLPNLMLIPVVMIAARFFLPFFRASRVTSAYEYLEGQFGPSVRVYAGGAFIVAQSFRVSLVLYLVSLVTKEITGLDTTTCVLITGVLVAFYTVAGGIDAVIWTDVIQTIVLGLGAVFCLGVIIHALPGGLGQVFSMAIAEGKCAFAEVTNGQVQPVSWMPSLRRRPQPCCCCLAWWCS